MIEDEMVEMYHLLDGLEFEQSLLLDRQGSRSATVHGVTNSQA